MPEADAFLRAGSYTHWRVLQEHMGIDVHGATLGLFGLGQIGQAVARPARGFSMTVLYNDPARIPADAEAELGVQYVTFDELLQRSDFLSVHAPLTPQTRHRFDADAFARMKPSAILINTARGPLVDESALAAALQGGVIAELGWTSTRMSPWSTISFCLCVTGWFCCRTWAARRHRPAERCRAWLQRAYAMLCSATVHRIR